MTPVEPPPTLADVARRRRILLDLALRRARPGAGSSVEFLRERHWVDPDMEIDRFRTPFVIVGGVATALYMPQRLTLDLDLLVLPHAVPALHGELIAAGYVRVGSLAFGGTTWRSPNGERLDVLESSEPWAAEAVRQPNRSPTGLPVIALPYLVIMKLDAGRLQDLADIGRMLGQADGPTRQRVRDLVALHRPDASEDIEQMILLGEMEFDDPGNAPAS
jgi:hypothetical protein